MLCSSFSKLECSKYHIGGIFLVKNKLFINVYIFRNVLCNYARPVINNLLNRQVPKLPFSTNQTILSYFTDLSTYRVTSFGVGYSTGCTPPLGWCLQLHRKVRDFFLRQNSKHIFLFPLSFCHDPTVHVHHHVNYTTDNYNIRYII